MSPVKTECIAEMAKPMTIGQLARRTGVPIKTLREYERLGFLYTLGRSEGNYRLFDETTLWCVHVVQRLRSLGLTLKEIREVIEFCLERPEEPMGPPLSQKLDRALARVEDRLAELHAVRQRIVDFQAAHAAFLAGESQFGPLAPTPAARSAPTKPTLDSTPASSAVASGRVPARKGLSYAYLRGIDS